MSDMQMISWRDDLALITDAAQQAGAVALQFFKQSPDVWWKNEGRSPVSAADYAANETLSSLLRTARPEYGWLSEETEDDAARLDCDTVFIVDPIDGTRAFISGQDVWCISVAVVHRGRPVAGVLYAPALGELYQAAVSEPALKNGQPISVSVPQHGAISRFAVAEDVFKTFSQGFQGRIERVKHVPSLAYRLAMVADGRLDGTFVKRNSHDWDLAAADLILERAGGCLSDLSAQPLIYNRPVIQREELCGAAHSRLQGFIDEVSMLRNG